ncbi:Uncharacterized protein QTN25_007820 [Entamoeba marina]
MNVVLYFTKEEQVLKFIEINKKCENVVQSMKINPFLENTSFERIKQLFQGMETYQLVNTPDTDYEVFDGISIIEYNNKAEEFHVRRINSIEQHLHKIRKLHSIQYSNYVKEITKNFTILRSLKVINPYNYISNNHSIQLLFELKNVVTLKELLIYISVYVAIDDLIQLRNELRNIKITIVIDNDPFAKKITNEYLKSISRIQGINIYVNRYNEFIDNKYVMPVIPLEIGISSIMKHKEKYFNLFSICYPTKLILFDDGYQNFNDEVDESIETNETIEEFNFDLCSMLMELFISFPRNSLINFILPTTLTKISITSNENKEFKYDSFHTLPLEFFDLSYETNKNITLPSTLKNLYIEECSHCTFRFKEYWNLTKIIIRECYDCIIPICDTYKEFYNACINNNKYINYGDVSTIHNFFQGELYSDVSFNKDTIELTMNKNSFIDVLDLYIFKTQNIKLKDIKTNTIITGSSKCVKLIHGKIKNIIFDSCEKLLCDNINSIEIIKGKEVYYLELVSSGKPEFIIDNINHFITNSIHIPHTPLKRLELNNIEEEIVDLATFNIEIITINNSNIKKLIIPTTITSFFNNNSKIERIDGFETSTIPNDERKKLEIKYCNGILPKVTANQFAIQCKDWKVIDARSIKVNYLVIFNCMELKEILLPNELKTLIINQCDGIETLDLTTSQLSVINIKNCKSIKTLLVNNNVKTVITSCPLLN